MIGPHQVACANVSVWHCVCMCVCACERMQKMNFWALEEMYWYTQLHFISYSHMQRFVCRFTHFPNPYMCTPSNLTCFLLVEVPETPIQIIQEIQIRNLRVSQTIQGTMRHDSAPVQQSTSRLMESCDATYGETVSRGKTRCRAIKQTINLNNTISKVKQFGPVSQGFWIPAESTDFQLLFSKTTWDCW